MLFLVEDGDCTVVEYGVKFNHTHKLVEDEVAFKFAMSHTQGMESEGIAAGSKSLPLSRRGQNTRAALLKAARVVLERDGYIDAKISDIAQEARVANGSFYTYFVDKRDIFMAMLEAAENEMLYPDLEAESTLDDPIAKIRASNRAYLETYRQNAKLMKLLEQVSTLDEEFLIMRRRRGAAFLKRNARSITKLQIEGLADASLDAELASLALSSMVSRVAYAVFVIESTDANFEDLVETVTMIWANTLRLDDDSSAIS